MEVHRHFLDRLMSMQRPKSTKTRGAAVAAELEQQKGARGRRCGKKKNEKGPGRVYLEGKLMTGAKNEQAKDIIIQLQGCLDFRDGL